MSDRRYLVREIFYSLQGEGARAGVAHVFVRFGGCNLACSTIREGFDCDTDFSPDRSERLTAVEILARAADLTGPPLPGGLRGWLLWTGGEPLLHLDVNLNKMAREAGWRQALETNGTQPLRYRSFDYIACSPKRGQQCVLRRADELRCVMGPDDAPPDWPIVADQRLLSPRWLPQIGIDKAALEHCIELVKANPSWRLSLQTHKWIGVR